MIQRIQTLFLLAAVIVSLSLLFVPIALIANTNDTYLLVTSVKGSGDWYFHLIFYPCIVLPFVQIFMYKNRLKQIKIGKTAIIYWFIWAIIYAILLMFNNLPINSLKPSFGTIIPLFSLLFIYLANKAIKKDEDLVRSIDRIR